MTTLPAGAIRNEGRDSPQASGQPTTEPNTAIEARQGWIAVLARAPLAELEAAWETLSDKPDYRLLRPTETGLAMVRGRIAGTGQPFNLGEMTMTRAAVQLRQSDRDGVIGFGHVAGRQARRAPARGPFVTALPLPGGP